jgi:hypothetical protein
MREFKQVVWMAVGLALVIAAPTHAQGRGKGPKRYAVTSDRAILVTRDVLVRQGYEVVRVEEKGPDRIVWYRAGNRGRGRGKGPLVKMVIHREADRVIFVDTPPAILVDIDVRLRVP